MLKTFFGDMDFYFESLHSCIYNITMAYTVERKVNGNIYLYETESYWDNPILGLSSLPACLRHIECNDSCISSIMIARN